MKKIKDVIKNWGTFILVALFAAILIVLFIISECTTNTAFMRIIYGIPTLMPAGMLLAWLCKRGIEKTKEGKQ